MVINKNLIDEVRDVLIHNSLNKDMQDINTTLSDILGVFIGYCDKNDTFDFDIDKDVYNTEL
jgi:hypothetical protein